VDGLNAGDKAIVAAQREKVRPQVVVVVEDEEEEEEVSCAAAAIQAWKETELHRLG
jgi:hypothetical protein